MKKHVIIVGLLCVAWIMGCSKKEEECQVVVPISDAYGKTLADVKTDGYTLKEIATIRESSISAKQKASKLGELKLTDEQLAALNASHGELLTAGGAMFEEMAKTFSDAADAVQQKITVAKGLEEAKNAVKDACDAKEKKRKLRRKKRKQCKKITPALEGLSAEGMTADKIKAAIDSIGELTASAEDVKAALDGLVGNLKAQQDMAQKAAAAEKKADGTKTQLDAHKKAYDELSKKLKAYCTAE